MEGCKVILIYCHFPAFQICHFVFPVAMSLGLWHFHKAVLMADSTLWDQLQNIMSFAPACMPDSNIRAVLRGGGGEG